MGMIARQSALGFVVAHPGWLAGLHEHHGAVLGLM